MSLAHVARRSAFWVRSISQHPANAGGRAAALRRAGQWHLRTRGGRAVEAVVEVDGRTKLLVRPGQFSSVWTLYDGIHEWEELQFCLGYLRPGDHFVDVGANVGVFSALIGTRLPGVEITAVEPFPPIREFFVRNIALNELDVELLDCAVGARRGEASFELLGRDVLNRLAPEGSVATATSIQVEVRTLDDVLDGRHPRLIKIDVEGSELDVMRGARSLLLADDAPVLLFEHCGHGTSFGITPADVRSFLAEVGYKIHLLDGDLTLWDSDEQPPTNNVVATRDIEAVRARLHAPGGAPAAAPVAVRVAYP